MISITNEQVVGLETALRGMRNPLESWDKSDSYTLNDDVVIGEKDHDLAMRLSAAGRDHRKYLRMIIVYADIKAGQTWWSEFDTYKVGTVRNSCSKMHKIHAHEFVPYDFDTEGIDRVGGYVRGTFDNVITTLEFMRCEYNRTQDSDIWRAMIELLPMGYHLKSTVMLNYEVLSNIYGSRKNHKLQEWREFCSWVESLPYSELITKEKKYVQVK